MFENHSKGLIQHCERRLSGQKFIKKAKNSQFGELGKTEGCGQTALPDRSILIGQKLAGNAKIDKLKCDILLIFKHCD